MQLFEITLILLGLAVVFLQVARRLRVPYPSLLALAGGCVAVLPFAPHLGIQPQLALALFVAPAVLDTAFDMPPRELVRIWVPLVSLAVVLVLLTTAAVAWAAVAWAGIPVAAAIALGAIVAPPDAAAASAVLREFNLPRRTLAVLQGESLLNDAVALLLFGLAVSAAAAPDGAWHSLAPRLLIAVPGGAVVGVLTAHLGMRLFVRLAGTLSLIIVQFLITYGTWILAERLRLSPIVAVVALAAVIARYMPSRTSARDRVNSYAIWATVVFVLNVLAFLLMGLQARDILNQLHSDALWHALAFAGIVLGIVIGVRFAYVMLYGFVLRRFQAFFEQRVLNSKVPKLSIGILVSWCGMRGLVTLATALALPEGFPSRDVIVLSAFIVVLGTLILQGFTIRPLIALLRIAPDSSLDEDVSRARSAMLDAALHEITHGSSPAAAALFAEYSAARAGSVDRSQPNTEYDGMRRRAIAAERRLLADWRREGRIQDDAYHLLEDELDRAELHVAPMASTWLDG
ncbi:MAG TPA: cation:proton antiporter [Steroidobacteraceae bacterium]|jgi:CPA1 family monovalent cation:H+ antiporter|nr:cation:proton antiporter [Steroidobacteraceae bacterium]